MGYTWDVVPKTFTDEVGEEKTIVGIQCNIVSTVEINRTEFKSRDLWIAFVQDNGSLHNARYISSNTFVSKMIAQGASEAYAQATVKAILKGLDYGTIAEIEANAAILAGLYGYTLITQNI